MTTTDVAKSGPELVTVTRYENDAPAVTVAGPVFVVDTSAPAVAQPGDTVEASGGVNDWRIVLVGSTLVTSKIPPLAGVVSKKFSGVVGLAPLNGPWFTVPPVKK
ncbi:MAG TPA: hypothetical protein VHQ23_10110, partial [Ilumatobacteraceae bacterium]|nr:hypothetical protein [Ilumatobacteraceae bacterium]